MDLLLPWAGMSPAPPPPEGVFNRGPSEAGVRCVSKLRASSSTAALPVVICSVQSERAIEELLDRHNLSPHDILIVRKTTDHSLLNTVRSALGARGLLQDLTTTPPTADSNLFETKFYFSGSDARPVIAIGNDASASSAASVEQIGLLIERLRGFVTAQLRASDSTELIDLQFLVDQLQLAFESEGAGGTTQTRLAEIAEKLKRLGYAVSTSAAGSALVESIGSAI